MHLTLDPGPAPSVARRIPHRRQGRRRIALPLARLPLAVRDLPPDEAMLREQGQRKRVLGLALAEAVALFGFVLLYLGHSFGRAIGFFVVSWVLIALRFPTEVQFRKQVRDGYDADFA